jgi:membrane protein implicated in regulation of membrane protease activity
MHLDPWLIWLIIGVICVIIEILDPAVFFISFGIAGLITSPISTLGIPIWLQVLIFGIISFIVFLFMRKVYEKLFQKEKTETNVYALVGKTGLVITSIPSDGRGEVKVGGEIWTAIAEDNIVITNGEKITVLAIDGNKLIVKKA